MDAIQIFVEGSGDVLFLKKLLTVMEPTLEGKWKKCSEPNVKSEADDSQYQIPTLTYRVEWNKKLYVLRASNGVSHIFPMIEDFLTTFGYTVNFEGLGISKGDVKIVKNIFIVDADDSVRCNGTGGISQAKAKIQTEIDKCRGLGIDCAGFAMPDNQHDGTLETILKGMIPAKNQPVIDCCWRNFVICSREHGATYEPPVKSMIDTYAKMFNSKAHGSLFASSSFGDGNTWDWNSDILKPIKDFLRKEVFV